MYLRSDCLLEPLIHREGMAGSQRENNKLKDQIPGTPTFEKHREEEFRTGEGG
jgi:hypothetical protein